MKAPEIVYVAQRTPGVLSVVPANYPGAVAYVRADERTNEEEKK